VRWLLLGLGGRRGGEKREKGGRPEGRRGHEKTSRREEIPGA
jgi:hypothetical protein